jgi:hypothetical protein
MKTRKIELDVDFIGDQVGLTTIEEKALTDYFKQRKLESKKTLSASKRRTLPEAKINTLSS